MWRPPTLSLEGWRALFVVVAGLQTGHAKQLIAIRIAPRVLAKLRRLASKQNKPYQTFIHELLEKAVSKRGA